MKTKLGVAFAVAIGLFVAQAPEPANASTLTYDVTLTPFCPSGCGPESGYGSFTITVPPLNTSGNLTPGSGLISMDFYIDGEHFALNSSSEIGYYYNYGNPTLIIDNIGYTGTIGNTELTGISLGGYYFGNSANSALDTNGSLTLALAPTPLPATLPLFAGGLGFVGYLTGRKKRKAGQTLAAA